MTTAPVTARSFLGGAARLGLCAAMLLGVVAGLGGCRGDRSTKPPRQILPDMDDSPKWKPQSESDFFADGRTMRPAVEGAVAFGRFDYDPVSFEAAYADRPWADALFGTRDDLLREDDAFYRGMDSEGGYLNRMPIEVTEDLIVRGRNRFNIYCSACHGYAGDGKGLVAPSWVSPVADFHQDRYKDPTQRTGKDGYLFSVVLDGMFDAMGVQKMPGYRHALGERDAWAIVAYVRTLQASRTTIDSPAVPDDVRQRLNAEPGEAAGQASAAGEANAAGEPNAAGGGQ